MELLVLLQRLSCFTNICISEFEQMTPDDVYLSFLPLAHILDRLIEEYFFHNGASVGYFHGVLLLKILFLGLQSKTLWSLARFYNCVTSLN